MMKRMSFSETVFLFFLALIIFGPKKLPEIARQVGKYLNEFRRASNEFKAQIEQEIAHLETQENKQKILPPSQPPQGTASRPLNGAESNPTATLAVSNDNPESTPPANGNHPAATQAAPTTDAVVTSSSQESHA